MRMALFFTMGVSLKKWKEVGMLDREIKLYNYLARINADNFQAQIDADKSITRINADNFQAQIDADKGRARIGEGDKSPLPHRSRTMWPALLENPPDPLLKRGRFAFSKRGGCLIDKIYFITYGGKEDLEYKRLLAENIIILPKKYNISNKIYSLIIPFVYWRELKECDILKTNQMAGAWSAMATKLIFSIIPSIGKRNHPSFPSLQRRGCKGRSNPKLIVRCGYQWSLHSNDWGMNWLKKKLVYLIELVAYKYADAINVTSDQAVEYLSEKYDIDRNKINLVPNYVDTNVFKPSKSQIDADKNLTRINADREEAQIDAEENSAQVDADNKYESVFLYPEITYKIRGACFSVWKQLKGAFKEKIIEKALTIELLDKGLQVEPQKRINILYKNEKIGHYIPDLVINDLIIVELKSKPYITEDDKRQFWSYLKGSKYKLGLLINFGSKLEIHRKVYDTARDIKAQINADVKTTQKDASKKQAQINAEYQRESAFDKDRRSSAFNNNQRISALSKDRRLSAFKICFVGRLTKQKNLFELFKAIKELDVRLDIFGGGELEKPLRELAVKENLNIEFKGNIANEKLSEELNKYQAFILPSLYEGNPKTLLEAMACGLPVIGARVTGINNIIQHKENGYLCGTSAVSIREAIKEVATDKILREKMSEKAREYILKNCSLEKIIDLEKNIFNHLSRK